MIKRDDPSHLNILPKQSRITYITHKAITVIQITPFIPSNQAQCDFLCRLLSAIHPIHVLFSPLYVFFVKISSLKRVKNILHPIKKHLKHLMHLDVKLSPRDSGTITSL